MQIFQFVTKILITLCLTLKSLLIRFLNTCHVIFSFKEDETKFQQLNNVPTK